MTLVLSVHSRDTVWVVVDRRLSYGRGRPPIDDAIKVSELQTTDGIALLAYAGIGHTSYGTQPSAWMSGVLRGRGGLTLEQALGVLATAAARELPRHLVRMPYPAHFIMVPAFVRGVGHRLYSIDNIFDTKSRRHWFRYTSHQRTADPSSPSARIGFAGSGGLYLMGKRQQWQRPLLSLAKAHDNGRISPQVVADQLATLNYLAHDQGRDRTVGPRCIVVWRPRPDATPGEGGGHHFYTGVEREPNSGVLPTIVNGLDVAAIAGAMMKLYEARLADETLSLAEAFEIDRGEMNRLLGKLPSDPDERLR